MAIIVDEKLIKKVIKRLKTYVDLPNLEDGVEKLINLMSNTEDLIEQLEEELWTNRTNILSGEGGLGLWAYTS